MDQGLDPEFNLQDFQSALKTFYSAYRGMGKATPETTASLENYANSVDGDLDKFITNLEVNREKTGEEIDLYESISTIIKDLDIAYTVIRHGAEEKWEVRSKNGFVRVHTSEGNLVVHFAYADDDDDDPGKMVWEIESTSV